MAPKAQAAPSHPGAPPQPLGRGRSPQQLASDRPKDGDPPALRSQAQFGSDYHKLSALNALEVLSLNNAGAREQLKAQGTESMLDGLASMGSSAGRACRPPLDAAAPSARLVPP